MFAHIAIADLVVPRRAIHFLDVHADAHKNDETFFRFPPGTSLIDTRTTIRHGERELDKHQLSIANGLTQPHDRRFQVLAVNSPAAAPSDVVIEEPKTHHILFDSLTDILCLSFPHTRAPGPSVPSTSRSTTISPPQHPRRRRKPAPWTINDLFLETDLTSPTDFSHHSSLSRAPSLTRSLSTIADPTPPLTPSSPFAPSSPSASTASAEADASSSVSSDSSSTATVVPRTPTPVTGILTSAPYTPRLTTATETLRTLTRVAIPYESSFGDTFRCAHCYETYSLADSSGSGYVPEECWPWRDEQREEGHEFRVVVGSRLEGLLRGDLASVKEVWLVPGGAGAGDAFVDTDEGVFAEVEGGPVFCGLDARFVEVVKVSGGRGVVAEMLVLAEEVERWMQMGRGWRQEAECRVMVPVSYAVRVRGVIGALGAGSETGHMC